MVTIFVKLGTNNNTIFQGGFIVLIIILSRTVISGIEYRMQKILILLMILKLFKNI